jgi:hypothetical protein
LGFEVVPGSYLRNALQWKLIGAGLLVGGVIVTFYSIRKFWARDCTPRLCSGAALFVP